MELSGRIAGRAPTQFHTEFVRELEEGDLLLRKVTTVGSESRPITKLRYQHHRLAQLLATGSSPADASMLTGYSPSRISILQADPAFQELLANYARVTTEVFADLQERMKGFTLDVLDELTDRLDTQPETYTNRELLEAAKIANDRGGNSPIARSQTTVAVLTAAELTAIKKEVKTQEYGRIINQELLTHNPEPIVGEASSGATPAVEEANLAGAVKGEQCERENV